MRDGEVYARFYDETNAFPSMGWKWLCEATTEAVPAESCRLCCDRFLRMLMVLQDSEERCVLLRPGCGDRQGDGPAAQRYVLAQDRLVRAWAESTTSRAMKYELEVRDPDTGEWVLPTHALYADDLARIGPCYSAANAARTARKWNQSLHEQIGVAGITQSNDKLQLLIDLRPGSLK